MIQTSKKVLSKWKKKKEMCTSHKTKQGELQSNLSTCCWLTSKFWMEIFQKAKAIQSCHKISYITLYFHIVTVIFILFYCIFGIYLVQTCEVVQHVRATQADCLTHSCCFGYCSKANVPYNDSPTPWLHRTMEANLTSERRKTRVWGRQGSWSCQQR